MNEDPISERRRLNMSHIHSTDTVIEIKVRHYLFHEGFRYRKNVVSLPGKPDVVLPKYKTVIFIHGCFWHRHAGCKYASTPKSRCDYWLGKFSKNIANDRKHAEQLALLGWKVIVVWGCEVNKQFDNTMQRVLCELRGLTINSDIG